MTLCGVLKDILLVGTSMMVFHDPVSPLQAFGYSIALAGLVYYRLGAEKIKEYLGQGQRAWADYGQRRPGAQRLVVFALLIITVLILVGGISTSGYVPREYTEYAKDKVNEYLGKNGN